LKAEKRHNDTHSVYEK